MLGLGVSLASVPTVPSILYTTFRTWANDADIVGADGFETYSWSGTAPTLSFETAALGGVSNYGKILANATQSDICAWRDNNVKDDGGVTINFADYTKYRVQAKMYASLDSSRTEITFTTSFGATAQDRFSTTLQDSTWTTIDVSGDLTGSVSGSHFYLFDFDQSGNFPISGEFFAVKDVTLSLG